VGYAKLINLDTGEVETFEAANGVLHIPAGRYAPTLVLDSQTSVATLVDEKSAPSDNEDRLVNSLSLPDQQSHSDRP
jgi:hypothetical protein